MKTSERSSALSILRSIKVRKWRQAQSKPCVVPYVKLTKEPVQAGALWSVFQGGYEYTFSASNKPVKGDYLVDRVFEEGAFLVKKKEFEAKFDHYMF